MRSRRYFLKQALTSASAVLLAGCDALSKTTWFPKLLGVGEHLSSSAQHLLTSRRSMAQEFTEADLSPEFRSNGTENPEDAEYQALAARRFEDWKLVVDGWCRSPRPSRSRSCGRCRVALKITRHDCVEGWSAIGKWKGVRLGTSWSSCGCSPKRATSSFTVRTRCGESRRSTTRASTWKTPAPADILAYELNDEVLPIKNGAPLRVRIERQLGYKMAKYIMRIEVVSTFEGHPRRQGRLLGRPRLRVVCRYLTG
jgi:DMSO/TMAO reductase YedYZ molybdopterin-dependent catalytic subunit